MKLRKDVIESADLPEKGQRFLWDDDLRGFGVRLTPTARTYIVQARVKGRTRRVTLGKHGLMTLQKARQKALAELSKMGDGIDPVKEKKSLEAKSVTLEQVVTSYLKDRKHLKASSRGDIEKHLNGAFSDWKEKPIADITRDMVLSRFRELSDKSHAQANQAFRNLRAWVNYAIGAYRSDGVPTIPENPVKAISDLKMWNHVKPRSGKIPIGKIGLAWNKLQKLRAAPENSIIARTSADAVSFLMLTGSRFSEMGELTWDRVNLDDQSWHIPDPKNREPITLPLPAAAVDMLRDRPRDSEYVFPGRSSSHIKDARSIFANLSETAGTPVTAHDLRRTFRAIAGEIGVEYWRTKLLMGHKMGSDITITHYTETSDLRYLAKDIELIAAWIIRQGAIAAADNVVQLRPVKGVRR